ncbi:zinc finger protein rotund [Trichonephila clavipes]|nr:zinc finger protein rotund [Trichonephila clavipes]
MDSLQMHNLYGSHGNRANSTSSGSSPVSTPSSNESMLVVPQPISAATKDHGAPSGVATNDTGRKYQCKMCPQIFGCKADLRLHTQIHMREAKPYKCSQYSKAFANSSYLSQHKHIHLGIKPYWGEICHRKFPQLSHLQQHSRTHIGDKPYKCRAPRCNKAFSKLSNLQSHSRCHQTDKPYKCNSCYKSFADEAGLLVHIPKHRVEAPQKRIFVSFVKRPQLSMPSATRTSYFPYEPINFPKSTNPMGFMEVNKATVRSQTKLIGSNSHIAPIKVISIPRLELSACLLLAELVGKDRLSLQVQLAKVILHAD